MVAWLRDQSESAFPLEGHVRPVKWWQPFEEKAWVPVKELLLVHLLLLVCHHRMVVLVVNTHELANVFCIIRQQKSRPQRKTDGIEKGS